MFKACTIICIFKWTLATAVDCTSFSDEAPFHLRRRVLFDDVESEDSRDVMFYLINVGGATISIALVAVIAGMFLGFLTLDPIDIRVKMRAAVDPAEREAAAAVIDIVDQNHRLLVTLLLMNALAYESLPLFLEKLMPAWCVVALSVSLLLVFGEIIPSAIFTGPDQLVLASKLAKAVSLSMTVLHPISSPLVKILDRLVPDSDSEDGYNRAELAALVRIQYEERVKAQAQQELANSVRLDGTTSGKSPRTRSHVPRMANQISAEKQRRQQLDNFNSTRSWRQLKEEILYAVAEKHADDDSDHGIFDAGGGLRSFLQRTPSSSSVVSEEQIAPPVEKAEVKVVEGALKLKTGVALDVYTPLRMLYALPEDMLLTKEIMAEIYGHGYSRVPVYEPQPPPNENRISNVKGILMTRQLIMIDWDDERPISSLPLYIPPCVSPRMNLVALLNLLRKGGSLVAFVFAGPHLAEKAFREGRAAPVEAGFMGIVTLQDVLESVLQERIYDEEDVSERNLASAVLTRWAADKIKRFMKQKKRRRPSSVVTENSPLLPK